MNQYTPMPGIENRFPELGRTITSSEYDELVDYALISALKMDLYRRVRQQKKVSFQHSITKACNPHIFK